MEQGWLPGFGEGEHETPAPQAEGADPFEGFRSQRTRGQIALFTTERELMGLLEAALLEGRFDEARQLHDALQARPVRFLEPDELRVLDVLATPDFWMLSLGDCLDRWEEVSRGWTPRPHLRTEVEEGWLRRLLARHGAPAVVAARPAWLPRIVNWLSKQQGSEGASEATVLVRDALVSGTNPVPTDYEDVRLVDLLAENYLPQWLASLGALRGVWPVPALPATEWGETLPARPPVDDEVARAEQFWWCLRLAASVPRDSSRAADVRKRMKLLHPVLHEEFMRSGVQPE